MRQLLLISALAIAGCSHPQDVPCSQNLDCDLGAGGTCTAGPSSSWCAYPDATCPSGFRYSDLDVGDGVGGQCVGGQTGSDGGVGSDGGTHDGGPTLHAWGAPAGVANVNTTGDERAPAISANGLELYFWTGGLNPPYGDIWVATRATTAQQFSAPTNITAVNGNDSNENAVLPAHSGLELFVSRANTIMISTRATQAAAWGTPTSTGLIATMYSLSNDDLTLYIVKRCDAANHGGSGPCLYRLDRTAVGQAWGQPSFIEWPGAGSNQWNTAHVSGDGLRILLSDPYSGSAVRATQAQRPDTNSPFGAPQVIDALSLESTNGEMRWNAAEDEVYLTAKPVSPVVGGYDIYVSVSQ